MKRSNKKINKFSKNDNIKNLDSVKNEDIKYDLTIALIVKNEEMYLEQCLSALQPLRDMVSCQVIVTDTGSTDRTVEIAEKYADLVLHFEWCNDFAKARNTGVDVAKGAWFLYIDADEIFRSSITEIGEFMKSPDRDKYDNGVYELRNYNDDNMDQYSVFETKRLYNFTRGKRYFKGEVHECILGNTNLKRIDTVTDHYGYLNELMPFKKERNVVLLKNQLKNNPMDMRCVRHMMDVLEVKERVELCEKYIQIFKDDKINNFENIESIFFVALIYGDYLFDYSYVLKDHEQSLKICEDYFTNITKIIPYTINIPTLEIEFLKGFNLGKLKKYEESITFLQKFILDYKHVKEKGDKIFMSSRVYKFYNEKYFEKAKNLIFYNLLMLDEVFNVTTYLDESDLFEVIGKNDTPLNLFINSLIKHDKVKLFDKVYEHYIKNDIEISPFKNEIFYVGRLYFHNDISLILKQHSIRQIYNLFQLRFTNTDKLYTLLREKLSSKPDILSLKELLIYLEIARFYIIKLSKIDESIDDDESIDGDESIDDDILTKEKIDPNTKKYINEIFELYIKNIYIFVKISYNSTILESKQFDLIKPHEVFSYIVYPALEQKTDNVIEYIKCLKNALIYCPGFKDVVANTIDIMEEELSNPSYKVVEPNNEFQMLSEKIKLSIINSIKSNNMEQALTIIQEYKKINPTDPDIANLINLIKN